MDGLSDLIDRQIGHARRKAGTNFERLGIGFDARLAISLLCLGGTAARDVIRPSSSLVCPHLQAMTVVVPDKRHVEIKPPQVDAKRRGSQRAENNGGECGNPENSADLSHDPAP
jgi:hypothetical protein